MLDHAHSIPKLVRNEYSIKKKDYDIVVINTTYLEDNIVQKCSNIDEFLTIIDW